MQYKYSRHKIGNAKFIHVNQVNLSVNISYRNWTPEIENNRGYLKTFGSHWLRPRYFFFKLFGREIIFEEFQPMW